MIKSTGRKCFAIMYRARHVLDKSLLFLLYCTRCLPYISYCEVWGIFKITVQCFVCFYKRK